MIELESGLFRKVKNHSFNLKEKKYQGFELIKNQNINAYQ